MWTRLTVTAASMTLVGVVAAAVATSGADAPTSAVAADITLELGDYYITGDLEVPAGDVTLEAVNVGATPHNVGIRRGPISAQLLTGKRATLDLGNLTAGTYELYCDIPGHVEAGMVAPLVVTAPVATT